MAIKLPTHLYRNRHGSFYFRLVIPQALRMTAQTREVRFSLHTDSRSDAIIAAIPIIEALPNLFADLRNMAENDITAPPNYFKLWIKATKETLRLQDRIEQLEDELLDAQRKLRQAESNASNAPDRRSRSQIADHPPRMLLGDAGCFHYQGPCGDSPRVPSQFHCLNSSSRHLDKINYRPASRTASGSIPLTRCNMEVENALIPS